MILRSKKSSREIISILNDQIDRPPGVFRSIISLNAHRYRGTSAVCGIVNDNFFILRNRKDPFFSLEARGEIVEDKSKSIIRIVWQKPRLFRFLPIPFYRRYDFDKKTILKFLKEWAGAF